MNLNFPVIRALMRRDLKLYFSNPTGYVFVTLFIFLSAAAAFWQDRFFMNNLANLDQLNQLFPYLLVFFVPAITMGVWADERRQGTDELLLTLPATDVEIVLGKYLSTLGIYTAALVLSLSHLVVLFWLGKPDLGLMLSNYIGYWLVGAAFIAVGMVASLLSPNVTIAFIAGGLFCAFFVYVPYLLGVFGKGIERSVVPLSVFPHFNDFARGVVSFKGLLYFVSVVGTMIYLNTILIGRRHWPLLADGWKMWMHYALRFVGLAVGVIALNVVVSRAALRLDFTAERLHSLSSETKRIIKELPDDRPVFVQAYLSPQVPEPYVQTRENLISFLNEIDAVAGSKVQVLINNTEPYSDEALEARDKFNISATEIPAFEARAEVSQIFMGVAFTCGAEESVIPFFERGLPVEYELARGIRVVARTERKKVGVLNTDAKLFGGFDFNTFQSTPPWSVVGELKKQYDVIQIAATDSITEDLDALVVALPSALPQPEMDHLLTYIEQGHPTMLLVDPLPVINIGLSPSEKAGADRNPFNRSGPPPKDKGNINAFMNQLGIRWNTTQIIWDGYNPHPDMANLPPEIVFVGRGNENPETFNDNAPASSGLQEMVMLFPGALSAMSGEKFTFDPLVRTGRVSGSNSYSQYVQRSFFGSQLVVGQAPHFPSQSDYTLAASVHSGEGEGPDINVIAVADVDFISEQFFQIRNRGIENLNFDNIAFFLNCIDILAGDNSFVQLRKRRVQHRTLETVEARVRSFSERRLAEQREAEAEAQKALNDAQQRLNEKVSEVQQRTDVDAQTKQIMARNLQEVENRRFDALKANIDAERDAKIERSKEEMESQIRAIQGNIKTLAGLGPPIPVFVLGILVFMRRRQREREGAAAARRLKG